MRPGPFFRVISSAALLLYLVPGGVGASPLPATADPSGFSAAPVWYGLQILLDVLVIYAVTVHFDDERD